MRTKGNKYLVVIEKTMRDGRLAWDCVEIVSDDVYDIMDIVFDSPQFYGDCVYWEVISINKEWKIGGSMVDSTGLRVGRILP